MEWSALHHAQNCVSIVLGLDSYRVTLASLHKCANIKAKIIVLEFVNFIQR